MTSNKSAEEVNLDFQADFRTIAEKALVRIGAALAHPTKVDNAVYLLFANAHRRVEARPYRVAEAADLVCPRWLAAGYAQLKSELEQGVDVNDRLSKKTTNPTYEDGMLNDWGITHFHLGARGERKHLRRDVVLFALVRADVVYAVGFFRHGEWANTASLEIVKHNWPELIEHAHARGVTAANVSDEEWEQRRKAGLSSLISVGGDVYGMIGGGYTSAGTSLSAHWHADRAMLSVEFYEKHVRDNVATFLRHIEDLGRAPGTPPTFRFWVDGEGRACAIELTAEVNFVLGPFPR